MTKRGRGGQTFRKVREFVEKYSGDEGISSHHLVTRFKIPKNVARAYLSRLKKMGIVMERRDKHGRVVRGLYDRVPSAPEVVEQMERIEPIPQDVRERLPKPTFDISKLKLHGIEMTLKKSHIEKRGVQRNILHDGMVKPRVKIQVGDLFTPMRMTNMHQRWKGDGLKENEKFRCYIDSIPFGKGRVITISLFGNGSVDIKVKASENPMDAGDLIELWGALKMIFRLKAGYLWEELADYFEVRRIECNVDDSGTTLDWSGGDDWTKCISVRDFYGDIMRIYWKEMKDGKILRREFIKTPDTPASQWYHEMEAMLTGGASYMYGATTMNRFLTKAKEIMEFVMDTKVQTQILAGTIVREMQRTNKNIEELTKALKKK